MSKESARTSIIDPSSGVPVIVNTDGSMKVSGDFIISGGDIQIGSVEIKNSSTDDRATVYPSGALRISGDVTLAGTDIQIGAVEIKDSTSANRAEINALGAIRVSGDTSVLIKPNNFQATINTINATSPTQVKAKTAGNRMFILSALVSSSVQMNVQFQDDAESPDVLIENIYLAQNGGFSKIWPDSAPLIVATNQDLDIVSSVSGDVTVQVTGYLAP